ncbi:hypothetical protein [Microbacterium sp. KNMS]
MRADKRRAGRAIRKRRRTTARVLRFALEVGVRLEPWQVDYLTGLLLHERTTLHYARARRGGKSTVLELAQKLLGHDARVVVFDEFRARTAVGE